MSIHSLVLSYGYYAVFALVAVESLGVPLPGETALVAAATVAGFGHQLSVWGVFAAGAAGAVIGDTIGYWVGDKGGTRLLARYGHVVRLDEPKLKVARYLFAHHGGKVVFFGRFVSVLRTYAAFLAGANRMHYRRFLLFNATGGVLWAAIYAFGAYYAGSVLSSVETPASIGLGVAAAIVIVVGIVVVRRKMSELVAAAERAFPGALEGRRPDRGPSGGTASPGTEAGGAPRAGERALDGGVRDER